MSGDTKVATTGPAATALKWVKTKDTAKHPTIQRTAPHNNFPPQMSMVPRLKTLSFKEKLWLVYISLHPGGKPWEEAMLQIADLRNGKRQSL